MIGTMQGLNGFPTGAFSEPVEFRGRFLVRCMWHARTALRKSKRSKIKGLRARSLKLQTDGLLIMQEPKKNKHWTLTCATLVHI